MFFVFMRSSWNFWIFCMLRFITQILYKCKVLPLTTYPILKLKYKLIYLHLFSRELIPQNTKPNFYLNTRSPLNWIFLIIVFQFINNLSHLDQKYTKINILWRGYYKRWKSPLSTLAKRPVDRYFFNYVCKVWAFQTKLICFARVAFCNQNFPSTCSLFYTLWTLKLFQGKLTYVFFWALFYRDLPFSMKAVWLWN